MHARMTTLQADPGKLEEGIRFFRDQVVPVARGQQGFKGARLLIDRKSGKVQAVTLWENATDVEAAGAAMNQQREEGARTLGASNASTEVFEVAVLVDV